MRRLTLPLWLLATTGCGSQSFCEQSQAIAEGCGETIDLAECEASLAGCTAEDEQKLVAFNDCVGECDADGGTPGLGALLCLNQLSGLSEACEAAGADISIDLGAQ